MSADHVIDVGDKLGQFKLVELIAVGGMGRVFRGYDTALDRYVAVKVLLPELARDPAVARRFLDEARAAAALNHANVVHIYSAGEQAGTFYFVMELVDGEHLEAIFNARAPLSAREAAELIRQAALGLQHAHEHGLIHGDVKPGNFLVGGSGVLKVTDFGLARRIKSAASTSDGESLFGTPGYVSPEVVRGQPADHRSDIFSLGATLFHALAGRPPFVGGTPEETLRRHTHETAPPLQKFNDQVPAPLVQIVAKMLAPDPLGRYQSYADLLQALQRLTGESPRKPGPRPGPRLAKGTSPVASPPPAPPPPPEEKQASWFGIAFTFLAFIACVLILILVSKMNLWQRLTGQPPAPATPLATPVAPVQNPDAEARAAFDALKRESDEALAEEQWGRAYVIYQRWPTAKYTNATLRLAIEVQQNQILTSARQAWVERQHDLEPLRATGKYAEAIQNLDAFARQCAGLPALLKEISVTRQTLAEAARTHATAKAAAEKARATRLQQLPAEVAEFITTFQWDKGRQTLERLQTELDQSPPPTNVTDALTELTSLVTMRDAIAQRLRVTPSASTTLTTKRGNVQGRVIGLDAAGLVLQQTLGEDASAETHVAWTDLTPATACRVLMLNLNANDPDELFAYAILIAHQALAQQAQPDDARKTLQVAIQRAPTHAVALTRYLQQLPEPEPAPAPRPAEPTPTVPPVEPAKPKPVARQTFQPLEMRTGCNTKFIGHREADLPQYIHLPSLENNGRVPIRLNDLEGWFNVRIAEKKDTIALANNPGQGYPQRVAFQLPQQQIRKYAQLAILSGAESGSTPVILRLQYQTGADEEVRFTTHDVHSLQAPQGAVIGVEFPAVRLIHGPRYLYIQLVEINPQRTLTALSFRRVPEKRDAGQNCVGIFAISALAAEPAP